MIPALLLALLAQADPADPSARWRCEPAEVEVGEPFRLVLELTGTLAADVEAALADELDLGESWAVLEPRRANLALDGGATDRRELVWQVVSLEPGQRSLGEVLQGLLPAGTAVDVAAAAVNVRGVLAEGEDLPRPLKEFPAGFAEGEQKESSLVLFAGLAVLALAALAALGWFLRARRRARTRPAAPSVFDRLGALESGAADPERIVERHYELTHLLRSATDGARSKNRAGLTDGEWLAELRASLEVPRSGVDELEAVFADAEAVKYAGHRPSSWAVQATLARARRALELVGTGTAETTP